MIFTRPVRRKVEPPSGIITAGLVLRYPCDEGTGTVVNDSTPNGHDGTLSGMDESNWVPGHDGSAIHIDAGNLGQHIFNDTIVIDGFAGISLCIRAKASHNFSQSRYFMHHLPNTATGCALYHSTALFFGVHTQASGFVSISSGAAWRNGEWRSIIGTYDGADMKLYLDGSEIATGSSASGPIEGRTVNQNYVIGANNSGGIFNLWDTTIDDIRTYNRGLTPAECAQIAAGTG